MNINIPQKNSSRNFQNVWLWEDSGWNREKEETDQLEKGIVNDEYICKESNRLPG